MERILLAGGGVVDGSGAEPVKADVLLEDDRIAAVGRIHSADARRVDCTGLLVAPGFIDAHSHSDLQVLESRPEKLRQGVTTEVVGNCGFSPYPTGAHATELREFANGIFCGGDGWGWASASQYLDEVQTRAASGVLSLVGHGSLRIAQAGLHQGPLPARDVEAMAATLDEALAEGAAGFSTGLMYAPGSSAPFDELEALCRVVARRGKLYATHMRGYFGSVLEALDEQLELARRTGCRLQISHLQVVGRSNWPLQPRVLEKIESAKAEGVDVAFDCYPYTAGSTVLTQILPQAALDGGIGKLMARLSDPGERARIAAETERKLPWDWRDILISAIGSGARSDVVGRSIADLAAESGRPPVETVLDLLLAERGAVNMISFNQSEENLRQTLAHPLSLIISDGFYVKGRPHPRLAGTFPRLLGTFVREQKLLSIGEAVRKITRAPADRFGASDIGRLEPGALADITVFDPDAVGSAADYTDPERRPAGIHAVFRRGKPVPID
ncbi:MAG TPA: D-aminoacylase [Bryobacteraceae bacterium]|nr:D-aminoacylase [Bryobacteraceae bacterium]